MKQTAWVLAAALLLLARGAAADDAEKKNKPAPPVDVPGFWTADELRRIDEGLDVLNVTRKDLGFQKRPIEDPFRLPVVNRILDDPLSIGAVAAEWDAVARTGDVEQLIRQADDVLGLDKFGDLGTNGDPEKFEEVESHIREIARGAFRELVKECVQRVGNWRAEFGRTVGAPTALLLKALHTQVELPMAPFDKADLEDGKFLELVRSVDRHELGNFRLTSNVETLVAAMRREPAVDWKGTVRAHTLEGDIVLYGTGDDIHGPDDATAVLVIDLGGNDTYTHGASANLLANRPVSVVIDLAGDDRYIGENDFSFGGALGGVAIQWDCAGNDVYVGGNVSCGAGILGVGVLVDEGGNDTYRVKDFGEGAGAFGIGLLLDKAGNDLFHADLFGQGFASTWGCGMLVELAGNDVYDAGGAHLHAPLWRDRFQSLSQGFSIGMRPDASGGVGVLVDVAGNDRYSADIYGQGASYWYSLGLLIDDDGHDTYALGQYGQGSGIHLSAGMLLDRHGQDSYYDANGVGMGGAHDYSVGFLVDREGDDYYAGGGGAQGGALTNSVAMLIDDAGDDSYAATRDGTQGSATPARNTGGIALLLDGAGKDRYTETTRNDRVWAKDFVGAGLDEPTPEGAVSADPMNAAMSKEDAEKKVVADGQVDGKWDLDKLWKLVTQWEVGDNTVVMPIARQKFEALGEPALARAFEHFDAKDSLLTRAIEKTLAAFPKEQWLPRLLEKTKDADKVVRKNAVLMVTNLKVAEALPRLVEMLKDDPDTTGTVLSALASMKTAPPEVAAMLKHAKEPVAVQAAVCLGAVGDETSVAALVAALGPDFAFPVRLAAAERLAAMGDRAVEPLWSAAVNSAATTMQTRNVLKTLGSSKSWQAVKYVGAAMKWPDKWVRLSAILATTELLGSLPAPETLPEEAQAQIRLVRIDLTTVRAAETDPLVKRLVAAPTKK